MYFFILMKLNMASGSQPLLTARATKIFEGLKLLMFPDILSD